MEDTPQVQHSHDFYIVSPDNQRIATADVQRRHGVLWLTNVWAHHEHRRKGLASAVLREVLAIYGGEPIYLQVYGYTNRPMDDQALAKWYGRFGFAPVHGAPGMMRRMPPDRTVWVSEQYS